MVRLACGHTVAVRAHLSDGARLVAANCPECGSPEPIAIAALAELSALAESLGMARATSYNGGSTGRSARHPPGEGGQGDRAVATSTPAPGVDAVDPN